MVRNRVEVLFRLEDGPQGERRYLVEELADPRWPDSIGKLRCPGGKIEQGEDARDALLRELREEWDIVIAQELLSLVGQQAGPRGEIVRYETSIQEDVVGIYSLEGGGERLVVSRYVPDP